jgi:WGR domain
VQSVRASWNGRDVAAAVDVLHAANRGLTRGMTLRAIQTHRQSRTSDSLPDRRRTAASARTQDIACKTLLHVFARKGLLPRLRQVFSYRMAVWPDLFGRALLARQWGRIGTQGRVRLDPHPDAGAAINALARLAHTKRRRSYRDRPW